ncbi:hypothetical protein BJ170DRAFT_678283 [Xylariales sp. AK1849]|nr:hypothetical protein BJ170DRAFT_678283 [Xylariales sp. AK1849]
MGIKGIYKEIGPGKRISLTKLAVDKLEQSGRPLRLAIDISIWQFQVQAARGGSNPAVRTLFYRLLRLLSLSIQPIFVFDGPNKPVFKRNKRSGRGDGVATSMAKRLIRLFGFLAHDAPGEAEAECALLQQNGIVDAVLSEDVDTIMFGCTKTMRNWSSEGTKGSKAPTHISMYDTAELRQGESGLDREGLVLVALMSGGDYLPEGIPGAGVKLACEAARGGFGKSVCRLKRSDTSGLTRWREKLVHELRTNESGAFRTKHKALTVPDDFPNLDVLRYYTHPVVSPTSTLVLLRNQTWDKPLDVLGLREFVRETFDWNYRGGAIKFIRVLAPGLLVRKMMNLSTLQDSQAGDAERLEKEETNLVRAITNRREHFSTDATPELRVSFTPTEIVGYAFEEEAEEDISYGRDGLALNSDDDFEALGEDEGAEAVAKPRSRKPFSPNEPDLFWIPETVAKFGIPLMVEDWEEARRAKASKQKAKAPRQKAKLGGMSVGAFDQFVKVTKNLPARAEAASASMLDKPTSPGPGRVPLSIVSAPSLRIISAPSQRHPSLPGCTQRPLKPSRSSRSSKQSTKPNKTTGKAQALPPAPNVNPWTIAGSQSSPRANKTTRTSARTMPAAAIFISSSPPTSPTQTARSRLRRTRSPSPVEPGYSVLATSPQDRRSQTLSECGQAGMTRSGPAIRAPSLTPRSGERTRQRLARTESMPTSSPRASRNQGDFGIRRSALTRARTIAVDPELANSDADDDDDLPPLSSFAGRIPTGSPPTIPTLPKLSGVATSICIDSSPAPTMRLPDLPSPPPVSISTTPVPSTFTGSSSKRTAAAPTTKKQSNLSDAFGMRTTKMYMPRKSEPGFFKEVEMSVDEVERLGSRDQGRNWRQSDISIVDLTGND